jgi:hypothetical protein
MTQEDIRKLLGGYATNALTDDERKSLFEAALEDQELFNALYDEDALRELLADPESRAGIRQALENRARYTHRGFWSRPWVLGAEAIALAGAAIVAVVLVRENVTPPPPAPAVQMASRANTASPIAPSDTTVKQSTAKEERAEPKPKLEARAEVEKKAVDSVGSLSAPPATPAPAAAAPASVQLGATRDAAARVVGALASPQLPDAVRRQFSSGFAADAPTYQGPLVRTSVIRSGPAGDAVRVEVSTGVTGYLALYEVDAAGNAKRVYP